LEIRHGVRPVLLVEDDEAIRESLSELLESEGYRVVTARNGRQALDWLTTSSELPALVLLDLMMPVMSGLEVLEAMRALPDAARRDLPVIVLTASRERPHAPGVIATLRKPIDVDDLLDAIARVFAAAG
jgi:CheY-like chemotaxis protein